MWMVMPEEEEKTISIWCARRHLRNGLEYRRVGRPSEASNEKIKNYHPIVTLGTHERSSERINLNWKEIHWKQKQNQRRITQSLGVGQCREAIRVKQKQNWGISTWSESGRKKSWPSEHSEAKKADKEKI